MSSLPGLPASTLYLVQSCNLLPSRLLGDQVCLDLLEVSWHGRVIEELDLQLVSGDSHFATVLLLLLLGNLFTVALGTAEVHPQVH